MRLLGWGMRIVDVGVEEERSIWVLRLGFIWFFYLMSCLLGS